MAFKGAFPVYNMVFKIGTKGLLSEDGDFVEIAELENLGLKIDGVVESWTAMNTAGWARKLMTGKSGSIDLKGKRSVGDPGNDYVHNTAYKDGLECSTKAMILFPDGAKLEFDCVVNVNNAGGDESTKVSPLEFTLDIDGKPTYTPAV
ncbi:MAG: phage tail tube protein [Coprobacillaceae bacterium]